MNRAKEYRDPETGGLYYDHTTIYKKEIRMKEMNMFNKESYDKIRSTIQKYGNTLDIEAIIGYINRQIVSCM